MHRDMLLLAERLVIAMETMSQDVRNMSAYVYDISCSVSYLLNERREKGSISTVAGDGGNDTLSFTSGQYELADKRPSLFMGQEHENLLGDIATASIYLHEKSDVPTSANNSAFTRNIKTEKQVEVEVNNELPDLNNLHGDNRNNVGVSRNIEAEKQIELEEYNELHDLNNLNIDSRNNVGDHIALVFRPLEGQTSQAGTSQMEGAGNTLVPCVGVHPEERSHKCSVCEKSFKGHFDLKRHMLVHSGEKPYKCNNCGKVFARNDALTLHMRCHTGEKPYKCTMCGKAFSQNINLRYHMRTHTGERPYSCALCGLSFARSYTLNQHMHTHSKEHRN